MTRLDSFIRESRIKRVDLAKRAGITRQRLFKLRKGTAEPTRALMIDLALAASEMLRRRVFIAEMFDLGESENLAYGLLISAKAVLVTMPTGVSSRHER